MENNPVDDAITEIDAWLKATKTPEYKLGLMAGRGQNAVQRVRSGTAQINTLRDLVDYVRKNPV